jgi:hypothetical protein
MADNFLYTYCIVRRLPGEEVTDRYPDLVFIEAGGVRVVAKYVPPDEYSEENRKLRLADEEWLDRNAREHLSVIAMVMECQPVIPFNFGTIFRTRNSLADFLADYAQRLEETLNGLEEREEWAVKAYCDEALLNEHLHLGSPAIAAIEKEIAEASPGRAYLLRKKKAELLARELESIHAALAKAIVDALLPLSEQHVLNRLIPSEGSGEDVRMLVNGAFLVGSDRVGAFLRVTENLAGRYRETGVTLDVTGPWPPYDFVDIPI